MSSITTASSLRDRVNRKNFSEIIRTHVLAIDAQIEDTHASGGDNIIYELPLTFGIDNMDAKIQRTLVHSEIVALYSKPEQEGGRGMKQVKRIRNNDERKMYIRIWWHNGMSESEMKTREDLLAKHTEIIEKK